MVGLLKSEKVGDLYKGKNSDVNYLRGKAASVAFRRVADCLASDSKEGLNLSVKPVLYQWTEERAPNHHKLVHTTPYPVGLLEISSSAENVDNIRRSFSFGSNNYGFVPIMVANSSGGVEPKKIDKYVFSIADIFEDKNYYSDLEELIIDEFQEEEGFGVGEKGLYADFIRLVGFDPISEGKLYLDVGNKPVVKKHPKNWAGFRINVGQLPPLDVLKINL